MFESLGQKLSDGPNTSSKSHRQKNKGWEQLQGQYSASWTVNVFDLDNSGRPS